MAANEFLRRLRGALGNALVWGAGWFALGVVAVVVLGLLSVVGVLPGGFSWIEALGVAVRFGIVGAVAGAAFSTVISVLYRGRRLSEISWVRFGIGGGIVTGVFVPLFLQTMNLLSGDGLVPWELVLDDAAWTAVFGGGVAGGSMKLAQIADRVLPAGEPDELERLDAADPPALEGERET